MNAWLVLGASILCNTAGNLLVKQFSMRAAIHGARDYLSLPFVLGVAAFGIGVMLYGRALKEIPIVVAYPIQVGACIILIAGFAVAIFGERIGGRDLIGVTLIVSGIALLSRMA